MKKLMLNAVLLFSAMLLLGGCDKTGNFPGADVSPHVAIYDLRSLYKETDLRLTRESMLGYSGIAGVVVSDHRGRNLSSGLLMVQNRLRLNELRGIAIDLGAAAEQYVAGDSVQVNLEGGVMTRVNGLLTVTGINPSAVTKIASDVPIPINRIPASYILTDPDRYESTELVIVKGGFDPIPEPTDTYSGDRLVNDGFDNFVLHTEASATFADQPLPGMANFFGVIEYAQGNDGNYTPHLRIRRPEDITVLSSTVIRAPIVISGYIGDVQGTDLHGEYIQFLATEDIDFSVTPFSVVTHNTTSSRQPTGVPLNGWAAGLQRSYKFDLTSGTVSKGEYFYVGAFSQLINGVGSTSIAHAKWILSRNTSTTPGDGFGSAQSDLFLNATSAFTDGIAIFEGTDVDRYSVPIDVMITGQNGAILNVAQGAGLRIANTDWYDIINPVTLEEQPFYRQGSNTIRLTRRGAGYFYKLGGEYNIRLGRWTKARLDQTILLTLESTLEELEEESPATDGTTEGIVPTKVVE